VNEQIDYVPAEAVASQAPQYGDPGLLDYLFWFGVLFLLLAALAYAILVAIRTMKMQKTVLAR
jgi:hypothetical protein